MLNKLTAQARMALVLAPDEARALNHGYIGTEHLLLAVIQEQNALAAQALASIGITWQGVRNAIEKTAGVGVRPHVVGSIPFTPTAKNALDQSSHEALQLGHDYVGTEHILLSLIAATEGDGSKILTSLSMSTSDQLRRDVLNYLTAHPPLE